MYPNYKYNAQSMYTYLCISAIQTNSNTALGKFSVKYKYVASVVTYTGNSLIAATASRSY